MVLADIFLSSLFKVPDANPARLVRAMANKTNKIVGSNKFRQAMAAADMLKGKGKTKTRVKRMRF